MSSFVSCYKGKYSGNKSRVKPNTSRPQNLREYITMEFFDEAKNKHYISGRDNFQPTTDEGHTEE